MELAFREYGAGQPLIILHGLFGQSDNWNTLSKSFAEKGFRVFTLDQRNHGLSPHSDVWDYDVMADDLKEFIETHNLKDPILLGHSMGGKTVMFFELKYQGIASKLIVVDIAPGPSEPHHDAVLKALNAVDFRQLKTRKEADAILSESISDFGTKQFLLKNIYWKDGPPEVMDWRFNLKVITEKYASILVPVPTGSSSVTTLLVRGENSNYVTDKDVEDFKRHFPNTQLATVAGSGHWVHAEKPREFFDLVLKFISA